MNFNLSKEQELLRDGLAKFLATRYDLDTSRTAAKTGAGWQPEIWAGFANELGILGAALPEEFGGIGGGPVEVMVIAEALGHALVIEPYVDVVVVAGGLLRRAGGEVATSLLERIVEGTAIVTLAATEAASGDNWAHVATTAEHDGDGWVWWGSKIVAAGAPLATHLLVTAGTDTGVSLFVIDVSSATTGFEAHHYRTIDDRRASDLVFDGLRLSGDALLGEEGAACEAVGCMRKVLADTVDYAKQRHQFGQPIGGFQALQHRMVDMYMELEQAVAASYLAILNLEAETDVRARAVSAAKATIGRAARLIGQEAVQLHGGMGMTEELAIGHYCKRLTALQYEFDSTDHHVARYAKLTTV